MDHINFDAHPPAHTNHVSQDQAVVPSLPKAPRLQLSSPITHPSREESVVSHKDQTNEAISFNVADLKQGESKKVASPTPPPGSSAIPVPQESFSPSKNLFGGGDTSFGFNFGFNDSCDTEQSFSFFGGGGCKSPEKGEEGGFFLNFGGGGDEKMEEESVWNFFGQ